MALKPRRPVPALEVDTLYWGSVSTMPFARPHFNEILSAIDFVLSRNYPARGEARSPGPDTMRIA